METSPRWSTNTKLIVMLAVLVIVGFFLVRFQVLIMPLIMAVILAYLLDPIVTAMSKYLRMSRTISVLILYGILILLLVGVVSGAGLLLQEQISGMLSTVMDLINGIPRWLESVSAEPLTLGPFTFDLSTIDATLLQDMLLPTARDWVGGITGWMTGAASGVASFIGWTAFAFIVAFYLLHDKGALQRGLLRPVPEDYKKDVLRLLAELGPIWNAFLRGQLLLSLIMGLAIGSAMGLLGVRFALLIGLMAALAEFVPVIGANICSLTAILIALFQPSNWLGLSPVTYAVVVWVSQGVLQQLESNFLVPRIMGSQLKLHPAILIIGALIGFSLLGLPGLLLSAPILATARIFGRYIYAKLFNLPPWPAEEGTDSPGGPPIPVRIRPARQSDRKDMLDLTAQIWEGHDYTPEVWSEWLADRKGLLAAAETENRMVGFGKLTRIADREWWLEGLRVHPGYQGMKIGSRLTEHLMKEWERRGGGVIRLATSSERVQVHRLCERLGLRRVGEYRIMAAKPVLRGDCPYRRAAESDLQEASALLKTNPPGKDSTGLVDYHWQWGRLTEERLAQIIRKGDAWWWEDRSAMLLTYDSDHEGKPSLEVAAFIAPPEKLTPMLRDLRILAREKNAGRAAWVLPDSPRLVQAARRAGYVTAWNARLWLFERSDSPAG